MLSNFINLIKTIIEMNEFHNFLSTSALKNYFLNIRPSQIENLYPTTSVLRVIVMMDCANLWGPTPPPRHCRHYHNIVAITISEKCFNTTSRHTVFFRSNSIPAYHRFQTFSYSSPDGKSLRCPYFHFQVS